MEWMIALLLFLAATSPDAPPIVKPPARLASLAPCEIVTNDEVRQTFKRPFAKGTSDSTSCEYATLDQQVVAIKTQHSVPKLDVQKEIEALRKALPEAQVRDAKGFSSPAFFLDLPGIGAQLFVIRGDHDFLLISVIGLGDAEQVAPGAVTLAKKALDRLPSAD